MCVFVGVNSCDYVKPCRRVVRTRNMSGTATIVKSRTAGASYGRDRVAVRYRNQK